jgi:hypothetical protein
VSTDDLGHAPAALLRYLYDGLRSAVGVERLVDMGMVTTHELSGLVIELERKGMVRAAWHSGVPDVHITDAGIAWVRFRFGDE